MDSLGKQFLLLLLFSVQHSVQLFVTSWTAASRPSCPLPSPKVCQSSCPLHQWGYPAISTSDALFSFCPQSFPASGTFPMTWLFTSDDQNTRVSFSISLQGWSPLRLTGLISFQSKGLSGIFSSNTVWRYQFFFALPSLWSSSHHSMWPLGRP